MDDLRAVAVLFRGDGIRFAHYLERRLDASAQPNLAQTDELDHVALYQALNYYHESPVAGMDRITYDSSYLEKIDKYFTALATGETAELPRQKMPPEMTSFIEALTNCRIPGRFEAGSIVLNLGDEGREKFSHGLRYVQEDVPIGRKRQVRVPINEALNGISLSMVSPTAWDAEVKKSAVQMEFMKATRWAVVQISKNPMRIQRIEILAPVQFSEGELAPYRAELEMEVRHLIEARGLGHNDKCPCSSGNKVKDCHGKNR
jgi:hypothetical protein